MLAVEVLGLLVAVSRAAVAPAAGRGKDGAGRGKISLHVHTGIQTVGSYINSTWYYSSSIRRQLITSWRFRSFQSPAQLGVP